METLCRFSRQYGPVAPQMEESRSFIEELKGDEPMTPTISRHVELLWTDSGIQATFQMRSKFQLPDSMNYFYDKIKEISVANYVPSTQDMLRSRIRTTGIVENEFNIEGVKIRMIDVGGQRNERKKWIHCFENVTAVVFVVAASEYDQVLFEDGRTNRMTEALQLFEEISNSRWFHHTPIILFLNKLDLFLEKIERVPLTACFPNYNGPKTAEASMSYLKQQFESKAHNEHRVVHTHVTCAMDANNVQAVFTTVKNIIVQGGLEMVGLKADS